MTPFGNIGKNQVFLILLRGPSSVSNDQSWKHIPIDCGRISLINNLLVSCSWLSETDNPVFLNFKAELETMKLTSN